MSASKRARSENSWEQFKGVLKRKWIVIAAVLGGFGLVTSVLLSVMQLTNTFTSAIEAPIRVDSWYGAIDPTMPEGVLLEDLDLDRNPAEYIEEKGSMAYSYPSILINVVGQADDENVQIAPYMVVDVTNVRSMNEKVDYVAYRFHGGGGVPSTSVFVATFAPQRSGVFYAPQATAEAVPGTSDAPIVRKSADYFTLASGEVEWFQLVAFMVPGYYYHYRVGVPYTYQGEVSIAWSEDEYVAGIPLKANVWLADWRKGDNKPFERVGDLQDFREAMKKQSEGQPAPPKYTSSEAATAIERQNREVRDYTYPYTPPQQIDRTGE